MFVIPDLSYFAIPGFINQMESYSNRSSSIILHNRAGDQWDKLLKQEDPYLITWLHNNTGEFHNIFLPYSPNQRFLGQTYDYFRELIDPAIDRIKTFLAELGTQNIDEFMRDSQEWLPLLFGVNQYYFSAELVAKNLGLRTDNFPMILIWTDIGKNELILLYPNKEDHNMTEYVKSLYWCIVTATKQARKKRLNIKDLMSWIEHEMSKSYHIMNYSKKIEYMTIIQSPNSVAETLKEIGYEYQQYFDTAILNFEEYVKSSDKRTPLVILCDESKKYVVSQLMKYGFYKEREGGNHEIWKHPKLINKETAVPRHNKLSPFVLKSIQKDINAAIA